MPNLIALLLEKRNWALGYVRIHFLGFPEISVFPKIISFKSFNNS